MWEPRGSSAKWEAARSGTRRSTSGTRSISCGCRAGRTVTEVAREIGAIRVPRRLRLRGLAVPPGTTRRARGTSGRRGTCWRPGRRHLPTPRPHRTHQVRRPCRHRRQTGPRPARQPAAPNPPSRAMPCVLDPDKALCQLFACHQHLAAHRDRLARQALLEAADRLLTGKPRHCGGQVLGRRPETH